MRYKDDFSFPVAEAEAGTFESGLGFGRNAGGSAVWECKVTGKSLQLGATRDSQCGWTRVRLPPIRRRGDLTEPGFTNIHLKRSVSHQLATMSDKPALSDIETSRQARRFLATMMV